MCHGYRTATANVKLIVLTMRDATGTHLSSITTI